MGTEVIRLPDVGTEQVDVIEIAVAVGDVVEVEQTLIVVESDKATVDVPSPKSGRVRGVSVSVGDNVGPGAPIIELELDASNGVSGGAESVEQRRSDHKKPTPPQMPETAQAKPEVPQADLESGVTEIILMSVPDLGIDGGAECIGIVVNVGDSVNAEDTVLTLESDKATLDIPAPVTGVIKQVYARVGDTLKQGDKVADIQVVADKKTALAPAQPNTRKESLESQHDKRSKATASELQPVAARAPNASAMVVTGEDQSQVYAGPSVRKLARQLGLSLVGVAGSGPKGRLVKDDVLAFAKNKLAAPVRSTGGSTPGELVGATEDSIAAFGPVSVQPLTKIQQVSAKNLSQSWQTIPHVTQFDEADVTELEAYRKQVEPALKEQGIRLTMLAFVVKAVGSALKSFPKVNSVLKEGWKELVLREYCHIAFAVDTPNGLVVPVVRDVWQKSVAELAREVVDLSVKARDKKLTPRDFQGASFTISSLGGIGGTAFTPIVNPPQVAILGLSRSEMKPVWNGEAFEPRLMLPISFSYDHRVIDGADGARFARELARLLGDIRNLLL